MAGGNKFTKKLMKPLRVVGLVVPIFIVIFGTITQALTPDTTALDHVKFAALGIAWIALGAAQFIGNSRPRLILVLYHLLATFSLLMMYNSMAPFLSFWILLALASYVRYQGIGLTLSLIWLVFTLLTNLAITPMLDPTLFAYEFSALISILTASYVIMLLSKSQEDARKELHQSKDREALQRNRLLSIINNQSDGIISVDNSGKVRVYNAASMWLLDTNQDLIGKKVNDIFPLSDLENKKINTFTTLKSYKTNTTRDDLLFTNSDDERIRLEVTFAPIRQTYSHKHDIASNDIDGYILIFRDVTKEKSLDEERDEFISVVSHELRTPLTVAEGALSNAELLYKNPKTTKKAVSDALKTAHDQVIFLAGLVNDLSTLSRAQRDVMSDPEVISVRELGHQTFERYQNSALEKGLTLDLDLGLKLGSVYTSRLYLQELLQNLVLNAIKYTQQGGVTIQIRRKGNKVCFAIKDTGIGISRNEREKIFEKFYRSEDFRTRENNGTGLGLYLSTQLADKMCTQLKVTSRLNHGSTFHFELPSHTKEIIEKDSIAKNDK